MQKKSTTRAIPKLERTIETVRNSQDALVGSESLLELLFPDERDRPSERWLAAMRQRRLIPYVKIGGRMVRYDAEEVKHALKRNFTVEAK